MSLVLVSRMKLQGLALVLVLPASCTGSIGGSLAIPMDLDPPGTGGTSARDGEPVVSPTGATLPARELAAISGLRRLTIDEYDNTVRDLLGDNARASRLVLPEDLRHPFDNDYTATGQLPSSTVVEGAELLASGAATRLLADAARRDTVVGCKATVPGCLAQFVGRFGRRALRRPIDPAEVSAYVSAAQAAGDFDTGVETIVRIMLQQPEFLYRVEIGTQVAPGLFKLNAWEMATRLSYFLWGSAPDDALLDRAAKGVLDTFARLREAAAAMLDDKRARERVARFHSMWMGYEMLSGAGDLAPAMKAETAALLAKVIFTDKLPWQDLLRSTETYVNYKLAKHYGLSQLPAGMTPTSTTSAWVPYTGTPRRGLLSHGSFLTLAGTADELLLPIRRGKSIRERLFCQSLPEKPAVVDDSMTQSRAAACKWDFLAAHRAGACAGCHSQMDPVGFGLDAYDPQGKFRNMMAFENPKTKKVTPDCNVRADGDLDGQPFSGPRALGDLMLRSPLLNACAAKQIYRFAIGRSTLDDTDQQLVSLMAKALGEKEFRFDELLLDLVSSPAFAHRRVTK